MACIRGFKSLSFQNLLYLQAELVELETEYGDIAVKDRRSQHPRKALYEKNWYMLSQSQQDGNDEQWKKFLEIRAKLKEYCKIFNLVPNRVQNCRLNPGPPDECLGHHGSLVELPKPSQTRLAFIRDWLVRRNMGACPILGNDKNVWEVANEEDLVALHDQRDKDIFSNWFCEKLIPTFHRLVGRWMKNPVDWDPESGIVEYSDTATATVLDVVGTIVSSLFPVASIAALYFVTSMSCRLGIVAGFTGVFSLVLALMTKARRVEIFAATTAFAAVLVVFISTNGGRSGA